MDTPNNFLSGVMLNAYPNSIGHNLHDMVNVLKKPEFKDVFSLFYILPTVFNSDLDRGFSIIDYNLNKDLVSETDLEDLKKLNIQLKFDIVLNHLSVASPQFKDLLEKGEASKYKDFFIDWNSFWQGYGTMDNEGAIIPDKAYLDKLFMRKSGLPILKVPFPDNTEKPYWNTFYQQVSYSEITPENLLNIEELNQDQAKRLAHNINKAITGKNDISKIDFEDCSPYKKEILKIANANRTFLGQMDVNAKSDLVWAFYTETLEKIARYGGAILRLDAFAYLHKQIGQSNFFNTPGTWQYLERIKEIASKNKLILLPEIHAEYGLHLHDEVAKKGYCIYDFFLPGLVLHAIEYASSKALINWAEEIIKKDYKTVNMLGCHDGIPILDLKGKAVDGVYNKGLLDDTTIETLMGTIIARGGRVKNLYDATGKKISYYQVNATFFSALGEDEKSMLLARAIQLFMPGIPQIWYLDIFMGKNNYTAADTGGSANHKEINRTNLTLADIEKGLKKKTVLQQLELIKLRNTNKAFSGTMTIAKAPDNQLNILWQNNQDWARLEANLSAKTFVISHSQADKTLDN
ncbi:MAG: glycosidase [Flavobacteriaceae bacterium]